ncbi:BID domain-containing T4SS effector [Bartonella sp. B10]
MEKEQASQSPSVSSLRAAFDQRLQMQKELNEGGSSPTKPARDEKSEHIYAKVVKKPPLDSQTKEKSVGGGEREPVYASLNLDPKGGARSKERAVGGGEREPVYASLDLDPKGGARSKERAVGGEREPVYASLDLGKKGASHSRGGAAVGYSDDTIYTEVSTHQPRAPHSQGRSAGRSPGDTVYAELSPKQPGVSQARERAVRGPLSDHEISQKVASREEVQYGMAEIRHWCKVVYGDPNILQSRVEQSVGHPAVAEALSWQIAESSETIHPLAGSKKLGIKSGARKEAEEGIWPLCQALDRYVDAVKQAHKDVHREHRAQQQKDMGEPENRSPKAAKDVEHHGHHHRGHHHRHDHDHSPKAGRAKGGFAMTG